MNIYHKNPAGKKQRRPVKPVTSIMTGRIYSHKSMEKLMKNDGPRGGFLPWGVRFPPKTQWTIELIRTIVAADHRVIWMKGGGPHDIQSDFLQTQKIEWNTRAHHFWGEIPPFLHNIKSPFISALLRHSFIHFSQNFNEIVCTQILNSMQVFGAKSTPITWRLLCYYCYFKYYYCYYY